MQDRHCLLGGSTSLSEVNSQRLSAKSGDTMCGRTDLGIFPCPEHGSRGATRGGCPPGRSILYDCREDDRTVELDCVDAATSNVGFSRVKPEQES